MAKAKNTPNSVGRRAELLRALHDADGFMSVDEWRELTHKVITGASERLLRNRRSLATRRLLECGLIEINVELTKRGAALLRKWYGGDEGSAGA